MIIRLPELKSNGNGMFWLSFYLYVGYCFLPIIRGWSLYTFQMPLIIFCYITLLLSTKDRRKINRLLVLSIEIVLFNFFFLYLQDSAGVSALSTAIGINYKYFANMMPLLYAASGGLNYCDKESVLKFVLIFVLITAFTTISGSFAYEGASRQVSGNNNAVLNDLYTNKNIAGYGFIYFLIITMPLLMKRYFYKHKIVTLATLAVFSFCIIRSEFTMAILLLGLTVASCFLMRKKNKIGLFILIIAGFFLLAYSNSILIWLIDKFSDSHTVSARLQSLLVTSNGGSLNGDLLNRKELYTKSWVSFAHNPIIGGFFSFNTKHVGGHSELIDLLGHVGIIGMFIFACIISNVKKMECFAAIEKDYFLTITFTLAFVISIMNNFLSQELLFGIFIMPILLSSKEDDEIANIDT